MAIRLLTNGFVDPISINGIDKLIYAFWISALFNTDKFCRPIEKTPIDINEWRRQREVWKACDADDVFSLGFSAFFLNQTNRSGIVEGAWPIEGYIQKGECK